MEWGKAVGAWGGAGAEGIAHGVVVVTASSFQLSEPRGVSEHMRQSPQQATGTHQRKERSCWGRNLFIQTPPRSTFLVPGAELSCGLRGHGVRRR